MKIAILGSTGYVGKVLLEKALEAGYQVKVLVRNPDKLGNWKDRVEIVQGEYFNKEDLKSALAGTEAVVSAIGAPSKNSPSNDLYIDAMQNLTSIMKERNMKRLIIIGGAATPNSDHEKFDWNRKVLRVIVNMLGKHLIEIKKSGKQNPGELRTGMDNSPPARCNRRTFNQKTERE